jgi:hypothetical protein
MGSTQQHQQFINALMFGIVVLLFAGGFLMLCSRNSHKPSLVLTPVVSSSLSTDTIRHLEKACHAAGLV